MEGTYQAYFSLLKSALDLKSLTLSFTAAQNPGDSTKCELRVHYPLMVGAKITGTFDVSKFEIKGRERHELIQKLMFKTIDLLE